MHDLSDEARALLDATRAGHDPSADDRRRLKGAMIARLGAATVIASSTTLAAASGTAATTGGALVGLKVALSIAALGFVAGTVPWRSFTAHPAPARSAVSRQLPAPFSKQPRHALPVVAGNAKPNPDDATDGALPVPLVEAASPPESGSPVLQAASPVQSASPLLQVAPLAKVTALPAKTAREMPGKPVVTPDALTAQVAVLRTVRSQLREGHAELALASLDSQSALFERGNLREEFLAARALALRDLGRNAEAQAARARLESEIPGSGLVRKIEALRLRGSEK